jgi:predicted NBD/HSP70 family sugar kinase
LVAVAAREFNARKGGGRLSPAPGPHLLRELSEQAVLETIFHEGPITRPEIAARTNLSKPTVSAVVRRLERARLIHPAGPRGGRRGRRPMSYVVGQRAGFVVGLDIGGTNLRVAAADIYGDLICEDKQATVKDNPRAVGAQIVDLVDDAIRRAGAQGEPLALGVSTPGVVDEATGRVTSLAYNVSPDGGFDPASAIGERFDFPVLVENNINLAAVGEKWNGLAKGVSSFIFVSIGAGVGMGISIDNELVRGAHGAAGEICYLPTGADPFDQRHRLHGALEDEVGAAGILAAVQEHDWDGERPDSARAAFEMAEAGDASATAIVERVARHVGVAIATVCAIIDPELVVLGGGIGSNAALLRPVRAAVASLVPLPARIETSLLGPNASLHGAIAVALREARDEFFSRSRRNEIPAAQAT